MHIPSPSRLSTSALLILIATFAACGDDSSLIQDGTYFLDKENSPGSPTFDGVIVFDRGARTAIFYACSPSKVCPVAQATEVAAASITPEADWGTGCPTKDSRTELEIVTLDLPSLTLGDRTIDKPVLVASCPPPGAWLSLHSRGQVPLGGCTSLGQGCLSFRLR